MNTTLTILTENLRVEGDVELVADLAPSPEYSFQANAWDCGHETFSRLIDGLLTSERVPTSSQRAIFAAKLKSGVWDLVYLDAPIRPVNFTPEGRIWPV